MKDQYLKMPYGTLYLKLVAGTIYTVQKDLIKEDKDWIIIEKLSPLEWEDEQS